MTLVQLPVDPRYPRQRSVELYNERGTLAVIGHSVGQHGEPGTYEEAAAAALHTHTSLQAQSALLSTVLGECRPTADQIRRELGR